MKYVKMLAVLTLLGLLFLLGILTVLQPSETFAREENRMLTQFPTRSEVSAERILSGKTQKQFEDALSDQVPCRMGMLTLQSQLKQTIGIRDLNDAYIGANHYYFERVTDQEINWNNYQKNLDRIEKLAGQTEAKVSLMLVPSSGVMLSEDLPGFAPIYSADQMTALAKTHLEQTSYVDVMPVLKQGEEQIYYRTDHHWTTYGAGLGYLAYLHRNQGDVVVTEEVLPSRRVVSNDFLGTLYSKTLDQKACADTIEAVKLGAFGVDETAAGLTVTINGEKRRMYQEDALETKDQYQYFFGGNFGEVRLDGGSGEGTIVVLKDSFANCFAPYLLADYETIIMIDMRFYPGSVMNCLKEEQPRDILVLYEMNNFANDTNLAKLALSL